MLNLANSISVFPRLASNSLRRRELNMPRFAFGLAAKSFETKVKMTHFSLQQTMSKYPVLPISQKSRYS
jgi:hypothetical protein